MKNLFYVYFILIFYFVPVLGQQLDGEKMEWSEKNEILQNYFKKKSFITKDKNQIFIYNDDTESKYIIDVYDQNLNKSASQKFNFKYNGEKIQLSITYLVEDSLHLLGIYTEKKSQRRVLVGSTLNIKGLQKNIEVKKIMSLGISISHKYIKYYQHAISPDGSKFAILLAGYKDKVEKKKMKVQYKMFIFDDHLNLLWEKECYDAEINRIGISDIATPAAIIYEQLFLVDNVGNLYVKGSTTKNGEQAISIITGSKEPVKKISFNLEKVAMQSNGDNSKETTYPYVEMYFSKDNKEIFIAYFGVNIEKKITDNIYIHKINIETSKVDCIKQKLNLVEKEQFLLVGDVKKRSIVKNKDICPFSFYIKDLIFKDNGELIILSEQVCYDTYIPDNGGSPYYTPYLGDILVINLDKKGNLLWNHSLDKIQVPKRVKGTTRTYVNMPLWKQIRPIFTSFKSVLIKDKIFIFYNEHPDNEENQFEKHFKGGRGTVTCTMIDDEGKKHTNLFYKKENEICLIPKFCKLLNENTLNFCWGNSDSDDFMLSKIKF